MSSTRLDSHKGRVVKQALDYLIKNAEVFGGDLIEPRRLDVGIAGAKIVHVGDELTSSAAEVIIDARGLYLCPGFIDTHASTGFGYTFPNAGDHKLHQGVTTEIIGNCGASVAPIGDRFVPEMERLADQIGFSFDWRELGQWFESTANHGLPFNIGSFVGHNTVRAGVCANPQKVTDLEARQMVDLIERALAQGAFGMSTGLVYAPGSFSDTAEIIELAKVVAKYDGIYVSHIRDERQNLEDSIEEAIEIGKCAEVPVLVSHLKAAEKPNWGKIPAVIEKIEAARRNGVQINFEVYPYTAVSTKLSTFIPKEALNEGAGKLPQKLETQEWRDRCVDWLELRETDYSTMILITESQPGVQGKSIQEVADTQGKSPGDVVVDTLIIDPEAWIVYHCISQSDMDVAILWPNSIICSDSWSYPVNAPKQIGNPHPRTFGAFTRFLERYALKSDQIAFGQAVRKVSSFAADWLRIGNRGRIKPGYFADLVLLNPLDVEENATFENPRQLSSGTEYLWVNGTLMIERGHLYERLPGRVLRRTTHAC